MTFEQAKLIPTLRDLGFSLPDGESYLGHYPRRCHGRNLDIVVCAPRGKGYDKFISKITFLAGRREGYRRRSLSVAKLVCKPGENIVAKFNEWLPVAQKALAERAARILADEQNRDAERAKLAEFREGLKKAGVGEATVVRDVAGNLVGIKIDLYINGTPEEICAKLAKVREIKL